MSLNRGHLSALITLFSMSIIVLVLYNITLGQEKEEEEYVVEMMLAEEDIEELMEERDKLMEEAAKADPIKSHMAVNTTAKPSYGNPEPLKTLDELMAENEASSDSDEPSDAMADGEYAARMAELKKKREEAKQKLGEKDAQKEEFTNNLANRRTSVSYSLIDRFGNPPTPIYTCIEGGKVVINIKVDGSGNVIDAEPNEKSSSTSNGCLFDNAVTYALRAKFNSSSKGSQKGTITYLFQQKAR